MKAYKIWVDGETEIISASDPIEAANFYETETGTSIPVNEFEEILQKDWSGIEILPESGVISTLQEIMKQATKPAFIASTAY